MNTIFKSSESAVAMAAAVNWPQVEAEAPKMDLGLAELYALLAQFADLSTQLYDEIDALVPTGGHGVYAYDVDHEFGDYFMAQILTGTFDDVAAKAKLGELILSYFQFDAESCAAATAVVEKNCPLRLAPLQA